MAVFTISFLILITQFSWSKDTSELMSQYEALQPFHENIRILMPNEKCKIHRSKQVCWTEKQWEDNSSSFKDALYATESSVDTASPEFLSTPLGLKYQQLKTFMSAYNALQSCSKTQPLINNEILLRTQSNISLALEKPDDCSVNSSTEKNSIALLGNHLQQITPGVPLKESAFEDDLFSQTLQTSIQARVTLTKQLGSEDINTPSFKQNLLEQFCTGNVLTPSSRGLRKRTSWVCTEKDEKEISDLMRKFINEVNTMEVVEHPIKLSGEKRECFIVHRNKKCVHTNLYEFQSTPPDFAGDNQIDSLDTPTIVADINYRISNLNFILEEYNEQKEGLEEKFFSENTDIKQEALSLPEKRAAEYERALKHRKFNEKLKRLKKTAFLDYKEELALLHGNGAGTFLQTDVIRSQSNFEELEKIATKALGILGFEEAELTHSEDFPLLKPISSRAAQLAAQEALLRIDRQIQTLFADQRNKHKIDQEYLNQIQQTSSEKEKQDLKDWYQDQRFDRLSKLILFNPNAVSPVLLENPEYFSVFCETVNKVEKDKKFKERLKTALLIGSVAGAMAIATVTAGAGAPVPITLASTIVAGTGLTLTDFTLRILEVGRHARNQENLLNAYLSQTGDEQSIVDIRKEWKSSIKEKFHAGWALALGTFDISRAGSAIKRIKLYKKSATDIPTLQTQNNQLQRIITENDQHKEAIEGLLQKHPLRSVQRLLNNVKKIPIDRQKEVLDSFTKIAQHKSFDLTAFTRDLKQSSTKEQIADILKRWAICISCRVKVGTKKTKNSSDSKSVIESSK